MTGAGQSPPPVAVEEYEERARAALPGAVWDYLAGGSGTEETLTANRAAYGAYSLRPRALVDVSDCDPATELLGARLAAPLGVAPMAYHRLVDPAGEVATARGAGRAGALFVAGMFASRRLDDIAAAMDGPLWQQLYWLRARRAMVEVIRRAEAAGCQALVLTVDTPRVGRRRRDLRNGFAIPAEVTAANMDPAVMGGTADSQAGESAIAAHSRAQFDPSADWDDLDWLRRQTQLPVVLKGVLTPEDAHRALAHGVAAVAVSNHGGRQLDGAPASLHALPEVVAAVDGRVPVLVDGGVRTGVDVLKALALGADAVLVGRPVMWGLASHGADGVQGVLELLATELEDALALCGRPGLTAVDASLVQRSGALAAGALWSEARPSGDTIRPAPR